MQTQDYIDINAAFMDRGSIQKMIARAEKEKERVYRELMRAENSKRSDRHEWKLRHEALHQTIRGLEKLTVQILVTGGRTPAL